jgi:hypothetical protein
MKNESYKYENESYNINIIILVILIKVFFGITLQFQEKVGIVPLMSQTRIILNNSSFYESINHLNLTT